MPAATQLPRHNAAILCYFAPTPKGLARILHIRPSPVTRKTLSDMVPDTLPQGVQDLCGFLWKRVPTEQALRTWLATHDALVSHPDCVCLIKIELPRAAP